MTTSASRGRTMAGAAALGVGFMVAALAGPAVSAATSSQPSTLVQKSVQTLMNPDGSVQATRLYTQIQSTGDGTVAFTDPTSGALRNLNGFGTPPVSDGSAQFDYTVDGLSNQRTLQDFNVGKLPITVKVEATLDGQSISPNDVVGKSGALKMTYTITNDTAVDQTITWKDGTGAEQSATVPVPVPYVGSFTTVLSDSYSDIVAPGASMGGTGRNSTQLSYNLLLYKPLGDTTAVVTFEAQVKNADIPQIDMTFLPAGPADNPSTKSLQEQIKGGADSGTQITDAGRQIDENLLKLAAGAGKLNAGLAQLYAGSQSLSSGLAGTAVPGAQKLAAGADDLAAGLNDTAVPGSKKLAAGSADLASGLNDSAVPGAQQVAAGAAQLSSGLGSAVTGADQLAAGASQLDTGLAQLNAGLTQLYDAANSLPSDVNAQLAGNADYQTLLGTLQAIVTGIGTPSDTSTATLEGGLNNISWGLRYPSATTDCAVALGGGTPTQCGAMDAVEYISGALATGATNLNGLKTLLGALYGTNNTGGTPCAGYPAFAPPPATPTNNCEFISTIYYSLFGTAAQVPPLGGAQAQVNAAAGALTQVYTGVDGQILPGITQIKKALYNSPCNPAQTNPAASDYCGISQALSLVKAGIPQLVNTITAGISAQLKGALGTPTAGCNPAATLRCAGAALEAGAGQVSAGASQLAAGLAPAGPGSQALAAGAAALAAGLVTAADGSTEIAVGNAALAAGLVTAADGSTQIADGANQLSSGLTTAADGATQIATGVGTNTVGCDPTATLACGASAIESGANQLSEQGSKKLMEQGNATASGYAQQYALMEALNQRAATQAGIPNGPATGQGVVTTGAYGYTLQPQNKSDSQNALRFLIAGLLVAGAVATGVAFARR